MADVMIGAAPEGQPGSPAAETVQPTQPAEPQAQPQVNYVTQEALNASMDEIKRMIQSSTDKSYNRVQKMISNLQQAGIQNPTEAQARAMLAMQDQGSEQQNAEPEAQPAEPSVSNPEAVAWINDAGGDPSQDCWFDIYDAAKEAGVGIITRDDPEYAQFFLQQDGQMKNFPKARQFVRAFEQAFEAKKNRLNGQAGATTGNLASSPALGSGGQKSNFYDPKTTDRNDLITMGLQEKRRR